MSGETTETPSILPPPAPPSAFQLFAGLALGVSAIAFAAIFFRQAFPTHPFVAAAWRLLGASVILSPFGVRAWRNGELSSSTLKLALLGGALYAVHFGAWVTSLKYTTVAASVTLVTSTPVLLALWAMVTGRDKPSKGLLAAVGLSFVGVVTIGGGDFHLDGKALWGDFLAWVGAVAMAVYLVAVRNHGRFPVLAFASVTTLTGGAILMAASVASGVDLTPPSARAAGFILLAVLIPQLIGHNLLTWSLRHTTPTVVGLATLVEPVGSAVLAWFFFSEVPAPAVAVGCAVTLAGVGIATFVSRPKAAPQANGPSPS